MYMYNDKGRVEDMIATRQVPGGCYILQGQKGLGKCFAACRIADAVLKKDAFSHPDFFMLEPDENIIGMEQIGSVRDFVSYVPVDAERKVIVINDADKMTISAQNAILKILEECTGSNLFLLVAHDNLLSTIRSRAITIPFSPLSNDEMRELYPDADECLLALAAGRPGIYKMYEKDTGYVKDCKSIFACLSGMNSKRELLEVFHQVKEKDKENFYEKYDQNRIITLLEALRTAFLSTLTRHDICFCNLEKVTAMYEKIEIFTIIEKISTDIEQIKKKGLYNKNNFFDLVCSML